MYAFKCGDDSKNKLKGISRGQSKNNKFEEKECLINEKYQRECDNCILRSVNHEMYLRKIKKKPTLSQFHDKRCYINETESKPWN